MNPASVVTRCCYATPIDHGRGGSREVGDRVPRRGHPPAAARRGDHPEQTRRKVDSGALIRVHPGVYRVGHRARSVEATFLAAVWACGDGAVLSGRAAAHLWGILKGAAPRPEVTARSKHRSGASSPTARRASSEPPTAASRSPPSHAPSSTSQATSPSMPWQEPATRQESSTTRRRGRSTTSSRSGRRPKVPGTSEPS